MAKTMTFKSLLAVLMIALGFQVSFAQAAFWSENFNSAANWVHGGTNGGAEVWTWTTDTGAGFQTPNGAVPAFGAATASTGYYYFNSDANGEFDHAVTLTGSGNPANCSGKSNVHLRFYTQYFHYTPTAVAEIGVSVGGGPFTYYQLLPGLPADQIAEGTADIDLPQVAGQSNVVIQFRWTGNFEYHWKVDDVELYEFEAPISDVTFKVNTALINVAPSGMWIIGNFTGPTPTLAPMTNDGGGIWSYTTPLGAGDYAYRFINGSNPANVEDGLPLSACGVANPQVGGFDRTVTVGTEDLVLPAVCFNSCNACVLPCPINPNKIVCDNMNQYNTTQKLAQQNVAQNGAANAWWSTWSGATGTAEDGIVTTEQANSAPNSFKVVSTSTSGGPQDVVLKLGNKTTGRYELKWMCYVPANKQAYYNIQNVVPIAGGAWNLDVFFEAAGAGHIQIGAGAVLATFSYPNGQWFEVKHVIDLDNNLLSLWVNGQYVTKMAYPNNLGGIDFYGIDNNHQFYIDDVEYVSLPPLVYNVDICDAAIDLQLYFGQPLTQTTGIYDNTNATVSASDPDVDCWLENDPGQDILNTTMWYTFVGDGQKYHIETVPCNSTNYIGESVGDPGDTQMLIYAGDNCNDLTEIACSDDLSFAQFNDFRSGLDLQTDPGQNYYMLIDGFEFQGIVALGEFCIEIKKIASVPCIDGAVGTYTASSDLLCWEGVLADLITVDPSGFVLPNEGIVSGLCWAITAGPLDGTVYPADDPNYLGSFQVLPQVYAPGVPNDNSSFMMAGNIYYFTPVVIGNGDNGGLPNFLHNIDITNGCYYVGESVAVAFLPLTDDITATISVNGGNVNLTPAGGIGGLLGDDSFYHYLWSNGATTQDLTNVGGGVYTCTVSDECSLEAVVSATVGTEDPASIQSFQVSPNPTTGVLTLSLSLVDAADIRIEVLNTLGQVQQTINAGKMNHLNQTVDLSNMAQGTYFLRVTVDGETAIRRVAVQR